MGAFLGENGPVSALQLENIAKHRGPSRALDGVSFSAQARRILRASKR
jgi:hypothetical protein